jgi:hypothetical protein
METRQRVTAKTPADARPAIAMRSLPPPAARRPPPVARCPGRTVATSNTSPIALLFTDGAEL